MNARVQQRGNRETIVEGNVDFAAHPAHARPLLRQDDTMQYDARKMQREAAECNCQRQPA